LTSFTHVAQDYRAHGRGAASLMPATNRIFFWFLLPSQLDTLAKKPQNTSTHSEANTGTLPMHQTYSLQFGKGRRLGQRHGLQSATLTSYFYKNNY
jgi:hypothetical protein